MSLFLILSFQDLHIHAPQHVTLHSFPCSTTSLRSLFFFQASRSYISTHHNTSHSASLPLLCSSCIWVCGSSCWSWVARRSGKKSSTSAWALLVSWVRCRGENSATHSSVPSPVTTTANTRDLMGKKWSTTVRRSGFLASRRRGRIRILITVKLSCTRQLIDIVNLRSSSKEMDLMIVSESQYKNYYGNNSIEKGQLWSKDTKAQSYHKAKHV